MRVLPIVSRLFPLFGYEPGGTKLAKRRVQAMANEERRQAALDLIREHIARSGHHIYVVSGGEIPRFAYTIGVSESIGAELVLAGASFYSNDDVVAILNEIVAQVKRDRRALKFEVAGAGSFTLRKAHASWATSLMRGALDY